MRRILGIDPGLRHVGWGIIQVVGNVYQHVGHGVIHPSPQAHMSVRLTEIFQGLDEILSLHVIDEAAIEETFVNANEASALKLGLARGVAIVVPALKKIPVFEYSANQVKKTVVGVGHAQKQQVLHMVRLLLPQSQVTEIDAADALAVAICHAHHQRF